MRLNLTLILIGFLTIFKIGTINSQESGYTSEKISENLATLYIVRYSEKNSSTDFHYFIDQECIGKFDYGWYLKVGVEPGKKILWSKASNTHILQIDLEANKTYVVVATPYPLGGSVGAFGIPIAGDGGTSVVLKPVTYKKKNRLKRVKEALNKQRRMRFDENELEEMTLESQKWIDAAIKEYTKKRMDGWMNQVHDEPVKLKI